MFLFEHMNALFLGKKQRNINYYVSIKKILMPLFHKKYFIKWHDGPLGSSKIWKNCVNTLSRTEFWIIFKKR